MGGRQMMDRLPDTASYTASAGVSVYGLVTAQWVGVGVGILCAIVTAAVSVWAKVRRDRREKMIAEARLAALRARAAGRGG